MDDLEDDEDDLDEDLEEDPGEDSFCDSCGDDVNSRDLDTCSECGEELCGNCKVEHSHEETLTRPDEDDDYE